MAYEAEFPPLAAPSKANKKIKDMEMSVSISLAVSGKHIAKFSSNSRCKVAVISEKLQEIKPAPLGLHYELFFGGKKLQPHLLLGELQPQIKASLELLAHVPSQPGSIVLPGVTGAAELPDSGDIIVASIGDITRGEAKLESLGPDDGPSSYMWLWRLSKSHGYALQHATLLTRRQGYSTTELREQWSVCVRKQQAGEPESAFKYEAFSKAMVEKLGRSPEALPHSPNLSIYTWLYAHSDKYVLLSWSRTGCEQFDVLPAIIDRLDTETGKVECVASEVSDLWGITTDPRDGTIYCATRYAGDAVLQLCGTSVTHPCADNKEEDNLVLARMGRHGVAFDPCLFGGVLVAPFFRVAAPGEQEVEDAKSTLIALPPGADVAEAIKLGAKDLENSIGWMSTPGDKSKPWRSMMIPDTWPSIFKWWDAPDSAGRAMMSFSSRAGKMTCLDFNSPRMSYTTALHTIILGDNSSTQHFAAPQVPNGAELITALNFAQDGGSQRFVFRWDPPKTNAG